MENSEAYANDSGIERHTLTPDKSSRRKSLKALAHSVIRPWDPKIYPTHLLCIRLMDEQDAAGIKLKRL